MVTAIKVFEPDGKTEAYWLVLPACPRQTHQRSVEIPSHPVEDGVDLVDHVRRLPRSLSLEGFVPRYKPQTMSSATFPSVYQVIAANPSYVVSLFKHDGDGKAHLKAFGWMEKACEEGLLCEVNTGLAVYRNMLITNVQAPREVSTGHDLVFSLDLREVEFATAETATVPKAAMGAPKDDKAQASKRGQQRADRGKAGKPLANTSVAALLGD
jgi:hypothetical protein